MKHKINSTNQELIEQLSTLTRKLPFTLLVKQQQQQQQQQHNISSRSHDSTTSLKLDMMSQLLCSQALLEAHSFKLLTYDRFNQLKSAINKLENKLYSINSKLNLEIKVLETNSIISSSTQENHQTHIYQQFITRFKPLHQQKELIQSQLNELRTSLLQHLAAVLAQGFKRLEQQLAISSSSLEQTSHIHHLHSHHNSSLFTPYSPTNTTLTTNTFSARSRPTQFDGPHLFANNHHHHHHHHHTTTSSNGFYNQQTPSRKDAHDTRRTPLLPSSSSSPNLYNSRNEKKLQEQQQHATRQEELEELKGLLNDREAIISEQAADLSLLELEVDTLKQSLSDQSSTHKQLELARSNLDRGTQQQIKSLEQENRQLAADLAVYKQQAESSHDELKRLRSELEILHSDRQLERMRELNETLGTRARKAEQQVQEVEGTKRALEEQLSMLKADLEEVRRSTDTALDDRDALQKDLERSQGTIHSLEAQITTLRVSAADHAHDQTTRRLSAAAALEASHRAEWARLASGLHTTLGPKLDDKTGQRLAHFLAHHHQTPVDHDRPADTYVDELVGCLEEYVTLTNELLTYEQGLRPALREELESCKLVHGRERAALMERVASLEAQNVQLETRTKALEAVAADEHHHHHQGSVSSSSSRGGRAEAEELDAVKLELVEAKNKLATALSTSSGALEASLREIWKLIPAACPPLGGDPTAAAVKSPDTIPSNGHDLMGFKAVYEQSKKVALSSSAGVGGSLGGLFGLGKRSPTPVATTTTTTTTTGTSTSATTTTATTTTSSTSTDEPTQEFSVDHTLQKIKLLIENYKKLADRIAKIEAEKDKHKNNSIKAQKLVAESQDALRIYQGQVKELEERLEYADTQSAAMLEKVNDLMESEEKSNMVARRAEAALVKYQNQVHQLQSQIDALKPAGQS
ncbi:hypothetical protein PCANC_28096 [Puccinia coronata f. sp. avenae]|uniref:Up-regulated during septation protein 1 domain-containing protein n=1 Tax=Puccinia coronata f. sp. avenae TaxID=200324 RepID=A0A2N5RV08_9BASI|nr:hypothetical protein PCANC_28096 [Puccinia coronata f. sp. avenae]